MAPESASNRALSPAVDKGGHCGKAVGRSGACPAGREQVLEDLARQERPACDESREIADRRRAGVEERTRLVGCIDAARRDEIDRVAEARARAPDVGERGGKDLGTREPA